ncbi:hypothetical protein [Microcystis sp.]|uniref:hypothetical protein n=1 Tax=Microcystis sp. TaxID=1127 RepID=UPI00391BE738
MFTLCSVVLDLLPLTQDVSGTQEEASQVFDGESKRQKVKEDAQTQIDELYRQIGQLKVERDFLANRSAQLGLPTEKPW